MTSYVIKVFLLVIIIIVSYRVYNNYFILSQEELVSIFQYIEQQQELINELNKKKICI